MRHDSLMSILKTDWLLGYVSEFFKLIKRKEIKIKYYIKKDKIRIFEMIKGKERN